LESVIKNMELKALNLIRSVSFIIFFFSAFISSNHLLKAVTSKFMLVYVRKCMNLCVPKLEELNIDNYGICLFDCYEKCINNKKD
jgi:hypothetical protein